MAAYGYNTSDNLSARERQAMLTELIDLELMSAQGLAGFLQHCFDCSAPEDHHARTKWEEDIAFMSNYTADPSRFLTREPDRQS